MAVMGRGVVGIVRVKDDIPVLLLFCVAGVLGPMLAMTLALLDGDAVLADG